MEKCFNKKTEKEILKETIESAFKKTYTSDRDVALELQEELEKKLVEKGYANIAKEYSVVNGNNIMKTIDEITNVDARISDMKRDNANIDGNTAMGSMLQIGTACAKAYNATHLLKPEHEKAHRDGDIHIHDFDFYALTTTCCQIDIIKLFKNGFSTGHGFLREPKTIGSYAALAAIAIQSNQNDQHGGQSIPNFDYAMAEGIRKTFKREFKKCLTDRIETLFELKGYENEKINIESIVDRSYSLFGDLAKIKDDEEQILWKEKIAREIYCLSKDNVNNLKFEDISRCISLAFKAAYNNTDRQTYQAMEGFIHNLNTMHSRAGAQTPFSSINYGTDTSPEGRMAIRNILLAEDAGLGQGETPIFPIHIFKVKDGVNYSPEDPNYDLFKLSMKVSAKRMFPNYVFLDSPFNLQYYKPGHPETEVATMGCRTRVMGNVYDKNREISFSRGNLSFTSINLPRIAIESKNDEKEFYRRLDRMLNLVLEQLLDRFEIQSSKKVYNYPFLMGQGVWLDSDKLKINDDLREVLKHGTLSIGFIGLAETLVSLYGKHHGESEEMQEKGLEIVRYMRKFCDKKSKELGMNITLLATPAEGLSGRFVKMDRKKYGEIKGVTDREYYTNSFHVPVYYKISAYEKIKKEAPYHSLTNAGHISYVEVDGDISNNIDAFEQIVRWMKEFGIGYGSINHPVDRDPVCGYVGVIGDICPRCGRKTEEPITEEKLKELASKYPSIKTIWNEI